MGSTTGNEKLKTDPDGFGIDSRVGGRHVLQRWNDRSPGPCPFPAAVDERLERVCIVRHASPVSPTCTTTWRFTVHRDDAQLACRVVTASIASMALRARFEITCCSWMRSPRIGGNVSCKSTRSAMD